MGTGGYLKERNPAVTLVGVQPDSPFHGLEGLKHLRHDRQPPALYDPALPDEVVGDVRPRRPIDARDGWPARRAAGGMVGRGGGVGRDSTSRGGIRMRTWWSIGCDTGARYLSEPHRWEGA